MLLNLDWQQKDEKSWINIAVFALINYSCQSMHYTKTANLEISSATDPKIANNQYVSITSK